MTTRFTRCPDCRRKTVHHRLSRWPGEDHLRCYRDACGWSCFTQGQDAPDVAERKRWSAVNPGETPLWETRSPDDE